MRDPIERLISCWTAWLSQCQAKHIKKGSKFDLDHTVSRMLQARGGLLSGLKQWQTKHRCDKGVKHIPLGLSSYAAYECESVLGQLNRLPLGLFVGRTTHSAEDFAALATQLDLSNPTPLHRQNVHTYEKAGGNLSAAVVAFLKQDRFIVEEYLCLDVLVDMGLLARDFVQASRARMEYPY